MQEYEKAGYLTSGFRFFHIKDREQREFSYHYHDFHKILILLGGDVTYCVEGRSYALLPRDIVLIHAGEVHRPVIHSGCVYDRMILYVSPGFLAGYREPENDLGLCLRRAGEESSHVLRFEASCAARMEGAVRALENALADDDYASGLHRELLFLEFMIQLNRAALHSRIEFTGSSPSDQKIVAVLGYLNEHLTEEFSIGELSSRFFLSRYYLMHTFKEQTGYTIGRYLTTKRLLLAKKLISEGMPITEVCYACGFRNYSTFSRAYKKSFGESPREFRQSLC